MLLQHLSCSIDVIAISVCCPTRLWVPMDRSYQGACHMAGVTVMYLGDRAGAVSQRQKPEGTQPLSGRSHRLLGRQTHKHTHALT